MITIRVEEYCHDGCEDFTPEVENLYSDNKVIRTTVYCRHAVFCRRIRDRLKERALAEISDNEQGEQTKENGGRKK